MRSAFPDLGGLIMMKKGGRGVIGDREVCGEEQAMTFPGSHTSARILYSRRKTKKLLLLILLKSESSLRYKTEK